MNTMPNESRIIEVESKLAYLENFITELQDVVVSQGTEIDKLKKENKALLTKLRELLDNQEGDIPNVRPPHY